MTIDFQEIPKDLLRPGVFVEIDNRFARTGLPVFQQRIVLVGIMLAAGTATALQPVEVLRPEDAQTLFGRGSQLAAMVAACRLNDPYQTIVCVPQDEDPAGVAATGSIQFGGAVTQAGTFHAYIDGQAVEIAVASAEASADTATNFAAAVNALPDLPVTAAVDGVDDTQVNLTCRWKGTSGNDIDVAYNLYRDEELPTGLTATITAMNAGTNDPDVTTALDALEDLVHYQGFAIGSSEATNLTALKTELETRWAPLQMVGARAIFGFRGTHAESITEAANHNSPHLVMWPISDSPTSPWVAAAAMIGLVIYYGSVDVAKPFETLEVKGFKKPKTKLGTFDSDEREQLLRAGCATWKVDADGRVRVERLVTTYTENALGAADDSWRDLNVQMIMSYYRQSEVNYLQTRYVRFKLATDGQPVGPGQDIMTPTRMRAALSAHYELMVDAGIMQQLDGYKTDLQVEIASGVSGRVLVLERPRPMGQLRQTYIRAAFELVS